MRNISQIEELTLLEKIARVEKAFRGTKYDSDVDQLFEFYHKSNFKGIEEVLKKFPTEEQLLAELIEKLKGKTIYETLKKVVSEKIKDPAIVAKSLSSLLTHTLIEIEQGKKEYKMLVPVLYERLGQILYQALK